MNDTYDFNFREKYTNKLIDNLNDSQNLRTRTLEKKVDKNSELIVEYEKKLSSYQEGNSGMHVSRFNISLAQLLKI